MTQGPDRAHDPIPRFVVPEWHTPEVLRNFPVFRSPESGPIVQITDNLWHAADIEDWMRDNGSRLSYDDFRVAALDPETYPEYIEKANVLDLQLAMAGRAFNSILGPIIHDGLAIGWDIMRSNPKAYQANPYGHYSTWSIDPAKRGQFLVSTQRASDILKSFVQHDDIRKREYKFLRVLNMMFESQEPEIEIDLPKDGTDE